MKPDIGVVISGHTHAEYLCYRLVVEPGHLTPLAGDPTTSAIVEQYKTAVAVTANRIVGRISVTFTNSAQGPQGEMTAGNLVADAQLAARTTGIVIVIRRRRRHAV